MPKGDPGASALASLLDGSTAGKLIPELVRHALQQLIELEVAAVLGADRHERTEERIEERSGYRNGSRCRHLPLRRRDHPVGRCGATGTERALAAGGPSHVLARLDGCHPSHCRGPVGAGSAGASHAVVHSRNSGPSQRSGAPLKGRAGSQAPGDRG